jgi:uncharacterized protein (TIGR04255 family)
MSTPLPTKITPTPIIEAVAEIIFDRNHEIEAGAVYGKVYDDIKKKYPEVENLPIVQLPEKIRIEDENFKNKPWHRFSNEKYAVLVGGNVVSVVVKDKYLGWSDYYNEIEEVLNIFTKANITDSISRIGLKYIDLFDFPIVNQIDMSLSSQSLDIDHSGEIQIRTSLPAVNSLNAIIGVLHNVTIEYKEQQKENVSLLDVDVFRKFDVQGECQMEHVLDLFNQAHDYQKELFFKLVTHDFLIKNNFKVE